ncbi:hypothetical protein BJV82DRAFT_182042 [Fennellomyces sp. T-0311]|nr:hypothetical protein BJV82DRAFT_182042 [Fennellomyces sp. T-0311]
MGFPAWAIICAVVAAFAILLSGLAFFLIRRRRRASPPTVDIAQDEKMNFQQPVLARQPSPAPSPAPSQHEDPPPKPRKMSRQKQHQDNVKINLPLPPPSASLFSDKMELSSEEAMELFDKYMKIDNSGEEKQSFYKSVQNKTATIRSTVRQSLRRQKSTKASTPLNQLFTNEQQQQTSYEPAPSQSKPPSPTPPTPPPPPSPPVAVAAEETIPHAVEEAAAAAFEGKDDAVYAARRVIRTASRKSKTRSMIVNEEDVMKMFGPAEQRDFRSVREKPTTGSVRRLVRDSIVTEKSATVSAVRAHTGATAREIAEWWSPEDNKPAKVESSSRMPPPPRKPGKLVDEAKPNNVDTIRRMLQASMTESGSMASIANRSGPEPVASFSSSTVRTMIPESNEGQSFGAAGMAAQEKIEIDGTNFALLQNGHQTWNGRANRVSRPSVSPKDDAFNTINVGRRMSGKRKAMPWTMDEQRTPAQRERDDYLQSH